MIRLFSRIAARHSMLLATAVALVFTFLCSCSKTSLKSPEGKISIEAVDNGLVLSYRGAEIQTISMEAGAMVSSSSVKRISESYTMISGKRKECSNEANARTFTFENAEVEVRAYNDGVAFRFIGDEPVTEYVIPDGLKRWMQRQKADYEGRYPVAENAVRSKWNYPSLVEYSNDAFGLITEAGIQYGQCGSYLVSEEGSDAYRIVTADEKPGYEVSPWRLVMIGSLADIVGSTLVTDVSEPCAIDDTSWIEPGLSAWIYWSSNHGTKDFQQVTEFIDLAASMGWKYNLIDWEWDEMANGGDIKDALAYAKSKGVKSNLWYNSGTSWIGPGAPGPQDRLLTAESREKEMTMLNELGASGVKVDFFKDDSEKTMNYYIDILKDAARHHLLVDFHGCTVPRGWSRTYPNLVSMEAVYGAEQYNNAPFMTNWAAEHNATLVFTRNVVGPMDYTPCTFSDSQHPHITTWAHELALPVLFESAVQHMADRPSAYLSLQPEVRNLLSNLPAAWDDTKLLGGYPGEYAVMGRMKDGRWYIAGINGTNEEKTISFSLAELGLTSGEITMFTDGEDGKSISVSKSNDTVQSVDCLPMGGFVAVVETETAN